MIAGRDIYYIDETTINLFMHNQKTWMDVNRPMNFMLPKQKGNSYTIFGAISTLYTENIMYMISDNEVDRGTTSENVFKYVKLL